MKKQVWIGHGVLLNAEFDFDGPHMTQGKNASQSHSLKSYRRKTDFSHVMSHVNYMKIFPCD